MGLKDLIISPFYLFFFLFIAFQVRNNFTNRQTKKYYLSALTVRFGGASLLGLVYQLYYKGGDTFNYWEHGSQWIWKAFLTDPSIGFQLLFGENVVSTGNYDFSRKILFISDPDSYFVVRIASFFDLLSYGTYTVTAWFFSIISFLGAWNLFSTLARNYPDKIKALALSILFFPSVIFWGSGLMKDSVSMGAWMWMVANLFQIIEEKKWNWRVLAGIVISSWLIWSVKPYILFCSIPAIAIWVYAKQLRRFGKNKTLKLIFAPFLLIAVALLGYYGVESATRDNEFYSLDNLASRAMITAYDIRYYSGKGAGSGYSIGRHDGTWQTLLKMSPAAVNVSFFRPYLWEVKNPLMILFAFESLFILIVAIRVFVKNGIRRILRSPFFSFCISYSILFGFAIGASTYNFGTLMRYKIPLIPLLLLSFLVSGTVFNKQKKN